MILFLIPISPVFGQSDVDDEPFDFLPSFTIAISVIAILFSSITLWKNYLSPFNVEVTYDSPTFNLYRIGKKDESTFLLSSKDKIDDFIDSWWIPSFDVGLTFFNKGQKVGKILDIRILVSIELKDKTVKKFAFHPRWIVAYDRFSQSHERSEWLSNAIEKEWYPHIVRGNDLLSIHVVLESLRWENKINGKMHLVLEYRSSEKDDWQKISDGDLPLRDMFYDGSSITCSSDLETKRNYFDELHEHEVKQPNSNSDEKSVNDNSKEDK